MKEVALGDLIEPSNVRRAGSGNYPILSMTMHEGLVDQNAKFKKRVASADVSDYKIVTREQLVVGFPIDEGVLDFQTLYDSGIVSPAYGVWDLTDASRVHVRYLKRFLRSSRALKYYKGKLRGSTARRRSLPAELFLALPVPLPAVEEQRRIAGVLDQVDAIRVKRRQVIDHLDTLTQSIFRDMFGDPVTNGQGLRREPIGGVAHVITGSSPSRSEKANFGEEIEWIKSDNLGENIATIAEEWLSEQGRTRARIAPAGSILVTCIAGSPESIGKSSLVDRDVAFNQQINAIIPSDAIDKQFVLWQLKVAPGLVRSKSTGGMKGLVNKSSFKEICISVPELPIQRKFATRAEQINAQRMVVQQALDADNELFASLQARAFRGEL